MTNDRATVHRRNHLRNVIATMTRRTPADVQRLAACLSSAVSGFRAARHIVEIAGPVGERVIIVYDRQARTARVAVDGQQLGLVVAPNVTAAARKVFAELDGGAA